MQPLITPLNYTYKKKGEYLWVLNTDDLPLDMNRVKDQQIVHFSPLSEGGNHKHPRTEWFVSIGNLVFSWLDENGNLQEQHMNPDGKLFMFEVPPFLAHAVTNLSQTENAILVEYADQKMANVEEVKVV